jgi:hypothetical protein
LQFGANWTWSKFLDDVESRGEIGGNVGVGAFANFYDRRGDKGLSGNHVGQRLITNVVWEIPAGKRKLWGGWTVASILELRSGSPFGVIENNVAPANAFVDTLRSNVVAPYAPAPGWRENVRAQTFFNVASFAAPAPFTFGNAGRTIAIGPGSVAIDMSLLKDFFIREGHRVQFRGEVLNLPNHPNFGLPNQTRGNANFGRVATLAGGNPSRIFQLGLHYRF